MAAVCCDRRILLFFLVFNSFYSSCESTASADIKLDEKAKNIHRIDSLNILAYVFLLILTVCTIWLFKHRRVRFLHETGLAVMYGLIIGAILRYSGPDAEITHELVHSHEHGNHNLLVPPDTLWFPMNVSRGVTYNANHTTLKHYGYSFVGEVVDVKSKKLQQKATFDPEIFFNILLPPIIFNAGYSLKRKYFFRNLGAIFSFAFIGTTISCFVVGGIMYATLQLLPNLAFTFTDCLYFGALISATDPVTVLAIFNDLHVDVNLYAFVFGESVLNDAVAIVMTSAITSYEESIIDGAEGFSGIAFLHALGIFIYVFICSFLIGAAIGCSTSILTKFTRLCDFPLLESCLFFLMSYSSYLMADAVDLSGIVSVLFCGICQAHYTFNNLSVQSRTRTKEFFELLNFLAENFIFTYIGVSMFTFVHHRWNVLFIFIAFLSIAIGRACNIYPLSFLLNRGRSQKIPINFQHMLVFSGLRGAMAFALAIRNTLSEPRQIMLTTTSLIVIVTVIVCGGSTTQLLAWFGIPVGVEDDHEMLHFSSVRTSSVDGVNHSAAATPTENVNVQKNVPEKAWLVRIWYNFDVRYMKPFLTHSRPTLLDSLPNCCFPLARFFTTSQQLTMENSQREDSDTELCLEESDLSYNDAHGSGSSIEKHRKALDEGDLGLGEPNTSSPMVVMRVKLPGPTGHDL